MIRWARLAATVGLYALFIFAIYYCFITSTYSLYYIIIGLGIACAVFSAHILLIISPYCAEYVDALFDAHFESLQLPQNEERPVWYDLLARLAWVFPPLALGAYSGYFIELDTWINNTSSILVVLGIIYAAMLTRSNKPAPLTNLNPDQKTSMKKIYQGMIRMNYLIGTLTLILICILFDPTKLPTQNVMINTTADSSSIYVDAWLIELFVENPVYLEIFNVNSAVIGSMLTLILITVSLTAFVFDYRTINRQQ